MDSEFRISNAAQGQFDIREDEEQHEKLQESLELLISAGYFRAKIHGLNAFDKIVGGMVWCISLCAQSVDVDLLYSENSTIGQKIALTERIVQVLPKLNCPARIEPHQIQGLDCIHIYPVIQWLVKEAKEVKLKLGDEQQNFSVYQFAQQQWKVENDQDSGVRPVVKSRRVYRRAIRMKPMKTEYENENMILKSEELNDEATFSENLEELVVCHNGDYSTTKANEIILSSPTISETTSSSTITNELTLENLQAQLESLNNEEQILNEEIELARSQYEQKRLEVEKKNEKVEEFNNAIGNVDPNVIEKLKILLIERDEIRAGESVFKRDCRTQIENFDQQIETLKNSENGENNIDDENLNDINEINSLILKLKDLMLQIRGLDREIVGLERQVERRPSQIELNQYQRRFVELYNQMSSKHRETKRQYSLYNTLLDVRNCITREIDLLNSIDDSRNLALKDSYKDSFIDNLLKTSRGVEQTLDKILCAKRSLQEQRDALSDNYQMLVDKQRLYMKTVIEFQTECNKNEKLRMNLENFGNN